MNTVVHYIYRDASNYKLFLKEVVAGETKNDDLFGEDVCFDPQVFYPEEVGFCADTFATTGYEAYEDDPDFHELFSLEYIYRNPTVPITAEQFVEACRNGACEHL